MCVSNKEEYVCWGASLVKVWMWVRGTHGLSAGANVGVGSLCYGNVSRGGALQILAELAIA